MEVRSAQEIWEAALGELEVQVSKANYRTWLRKTVGLSYQDSQFVIGVPNTFVAEYLDKNQRSLIEKTLVSLTGQETKVIFYVDGWYKNSLGDYGAQEETFSTTPVHSPRLNPKYTFTSFIVGNCNRLAYAAAQEVAKNPGITYNPLFIYGGIGLGKTHLLNAVGCAVLATNRKVLYVSAERFTNEFIHSVQEKKTKEFRNKYRDADVLLIDDINFLGGKGQTEESFFHTFNELHNNNRQIVITSDRPPKSMLLLQGRLRSRFEWGLVVDIQPPDFETRVAILQARAERSGVRVTSDVLGVIAEHVQQNIRELEGALNRVVAYAKLVRALPTPELATQALGDIASRGPKSMSVTLSLVIEHVASSFQLTPQDLKSRKRDRKTSLARQTAMYLIRQETNYSLAQIGQELGGREPITVSNACKKIANNIKNNSSLRHEISAIQREIYANRS
jgi:chromosomal replication initiator protein